MATALRAAGYEPQPIFDRRSIPAYSIILIELTLAAPLIWVTGLSFDDPTMLLPPFWAPLLLLSGWLARRIGRERIGGACETMVLIYTQGLVGLALILPLAVISAPFADASLARIDAMLGFDWRELASAFRDHPELLAAQVRIYRSFLWQPALIVIALWSLGSGDRVWRLVTAGALSLFLCAVIFPLVPAVGAFHYFGIEPSDYPNLYASTPWAFGPTIQALKASPHVASNMLTGFVSFPSYHAATAVMFSWAMWPVARLRWPFIVLNAGMAASALIVGAHYLVDIVGGMLIAVAAISFSGMLLSGRCSHYLKRIALRPWSTETHPSAH